MQLSISTRLVLLVALLVTATATTISYYLYKNGVSILAEHALQDLSLNLQRDGHQLSSHIDELKRDVLFLSKSPPVPGIIRAKNNRGYDPLGKSTSEQWHERLTDIFSNMLSTNTDYMQIRLLDAGGTELIKLIQTRDGLHVAPPQERQDKSTTTYFRQAITIPAGQIYLSPIELNREFGKISLPHTPVLRAATPIFDNGKLFGIIIINLNFSHLLDSLEATYSTHEQTLYITNHHGAYLSHPQPDKRFAFELGHHFRIHEDFPHFASLFAPGNPKLDQYFIPRDASQDILVFVKIPYDKANPDKFVAIGLARSYQNIIQQETQVLQKNAPIVILLIILSILLAAGFGNLLVRPLKQIASNLDNITSGDKPPLPVERTDEIGTLARALEGMADNVFHSHQELRALNSRLEDEVEVRTFEVQQNFRLVKTISQAQTAFIGEPETRHAFELLLSGLLEVSDSEYGFIGEVLYQDDATPYLKTRAISNIAWNAETHKLYEENAGQGLAFYNLDSLFGAVMTTGKAVISNDPANDERASGIPTGHPALNAFLGIPIYSLDKLIGMAGVANRQQGYSDALLQQLEPFITTCAHMMASIQTRQAAQQKDLELRQTRADLERAIQSSTAVFYTARASGDFGATFISDNIRNQLGYEPEEFTRDPTFWAEHIHPDDKPRVFEELVHLFECGEHTHSYRFLHKDGTYRWMQDELRLQYNEQGQPLEMAGFWTDVTERKQAELQLQESEQRFRRMADGAPALIWLADTENMGTWFNKSWLDYTGRTLQQELGLGWADGVHPEDLEISVKICNSAFNQREAFEMEFRLRRADGTYGWIVDSGIPRFTDDGEFEGYIGYCWDISDRKLVENALQDSEKKFRSVINSSPMGMFIYQLHDEQLIFSDYNPAANTILGVDCSQFIGKTIEQAFPKLAETDIPQQYRRAAREGVPWHQEDVIYDDQQNISGAFEVYAFQTAPDTMAAMFMDVTQRKKTQDELTRFKSTLDQTQDCVFMFTVDSLQYFYVNQGAMFLVGYSQQELQQLHPYDIDAQQPSETEFREFIQPLLEGSQLSFTYETEYLSKDGQQVPVEIILQYIGHTTQSARFVAMVRDITERKKIDRMKNEFVSTVSHELRTPLTSIRGSLGLLTGGAVGELSDKTQEMLQIASNNTDRLLLLINDILDIQKIESGQMAFHFAPIDVMSLVEQAIIDNTSYARQHNVQFCITHRKDRVHVLGDRDRLMQVLNNLMSNAAKFSPDGSNVELAIAQHGEAVRISVTDYGQGIAEEFQSRLFEQFTQHDASDTRQKGGTGLGLSIVKAIIDKHGGRVDFITRQGLGTTMIVELPYCKASHHSNPDRPDIQLGEHRPCILILEDDQDIAMLLNRLLSSAGYSCDIALNTDEARRLLQINTNDYRAMTLDIRLPDGDGVSFIKEIRSQSATQSLPIIVVSVEADAARRRLNGGAIGIIDWLDKPIDEQRLLHALGSIGEHKIKPSLLHIEDEADIQHIVKSLLQDKVKFSSANNLEEARNILSRKHFDLIMLDLALPDGSGTSLLTELEQQHPSSKLLVYSAHTLAPEYMQQVHAVLSKANADNDKLLQTIEILLAQYPPHN